MTKRHPMRAAALLVSVMLLGAATWTSAAQRVAESRRDVAPALAIGRDSVAVWLAETGGGSRVVAAAPAGGIAEPIAPDGPGADGAPAVAAIRGKDVLVVASRRNGAVSSLWSRQRTATGWGPVVGLPTVGRENHHPAVASSDAGAWVVWATRDPASFDRLVASHWNGKGWSPPEEIPSAPGMAMRPTVAVNGRGEPVAVWAASDGGDSEIWVSRRGRRGWTRPAQITDNEVADIEPRATAVADGPVLVAWSQMTSAGYVPHAAHVRARSSSRPRMLSRRAGNAPVVVGARRPTVLWTRPSDAQGRSEVVGKYLEGRRWNALRPLGTASNARLSAVASGGRILVGWHEGAGLRLREAPDRDSPAGWHLQDLRRGGPRVRPVARVDLPGSYVAFGDSITEGLVRVDGQISFVEPYTTQLAALIQELVRQPVSVLNLGVSGELTSEAVNRIDLALSSRPSFILIMEGANDIANLIDPAITAANLRYIVQRAKAFDAVPLIATVTPRTEGGFEGEINLRVDWVNDLIVLMAEQEQAMLVDQHGAFLYRGGLYSDEIHPNAEGYKWMGEVWFRSLRPVLKHWLEQTDTDDAIDQDGRLRSSRRPGRGGIQD